MRLGGALARRARARARSDKRFYIHRTGFCLFERRIEVWFREIEHTQVYVIASALSLTDSRLAYALLIGYKPVCQALLLDGSFFHGVFVRVDAMKPNYTDCAG